MPNPILRPVRELPYTWFRRWRDAADARGDARADIVGNDRPTPWLERNRYTLLERCASARLEIERTENPILERYRSVVARAAALEEAITDADERLVLDAPTEAELAVRHSSETELTDAAVRTRRSRDLAPRTAGLAARRAGWVEELTKLRLEYGDLVGRIQVAWRMLIDGVEQLTQFHARRQETYRRAYVRRVARRRELTSDDPVLSAHELVAPTWASEPCSWLATESLRASEQPPEPVVV